MKETLSLFLPLEIARVAYRLPFPLYREKRSPDWIMKTYNTLIIYKIKPKELYGKKNLYVR